MKRYVISLRPSGTRLGLCDTIGEAIAMIAQVVDSGKHASILDAQGSGHILVTQFDLMEAEAYIGRSLGSAHIQRPTPIEEIISSIEASRPKKTAHHWGIDG